MPTSPLRRTGRLPTALLITGCALWAVAPVAAVVTLTVQSRHVELTPETQVWAPVEANSGQVAAAVDILIEWEPVSPVVAPAWSGVVQSVSAVTGAQLVSGASFAVIDGITRLAYASGQPFYRPLGLGDVGQDAAALNVLLTERGLAAGDSDEITWSTISGVQELAASLGVPNPYDVSGFDPSWVVYLPTSPVDLGSVDLVVGAPAPSPGTVIAELDQRLASARLATPGEDDDASRPGLVAEHGQQLTVAGTDVGLAEDRTTVADPGALRELVADEATSVAGQLSRPAARSEWVVPAAAVVAGEGGVTCVVTGSADAPATVRVEVVGGQLGRAVVIGRLADNDEVAVRPAAHLRQCA